MARRWAEQKEAVLKGCSVRWSHTSTLQIFALQRTRFKGSQSRLKPLAPRRINYPVCTCATCASDSVFDVETEEQRDKRPGWKAGSISPKELLPVRVTCPRSCCGELADGCATADESRRLVSRGCSPAQGDDGCCTSHTGLLRSKPVCCGKDRPFGLIVED